MPNLLIPNGKAPALDGREGLNLVLRTTAPPHSKDRTDVHILLPAPRRKSR